eukprot:891526-Pyramimonas_sp.AAC.1
MRWGPRAGRRKSSDGQRPGGRARTKAELGGEEQEMGNGCEGEGSGAGGGGGGSGDRGGRGR